MIVAVALVTNQPIVDTTASAGALIGLAFVVGDWRCRPILDSLVLPAHASSRGGFDQTIGVGSILVGSSTNRVDVVVVAVVSSIHASLVVVLFQLSSLFPLFQRSDFYCSSFSASQTVTKPGLGRFDPFILSPFASLDTI